MLRFLRQSRVSLNLQSARVTTASVFFYSAGIPLSYVRARRKVDRICVGQCASPKPSLNANHHSDSRAHSSMIRLRYSPKEYKSQAEEPSIAQTDTNAGKPPLASVQFTRVGKRFCPSLLM